MILHANLVLTIKMFWSTTNTSSMLIAERGDNTGQLQ
jgi:hypothetical protein